MFPRDVSLYTSKRLRDLILGKEWTVSIGKRREREKREAAIPASQSGSANYEAEDRSVALSRRERKQRKKEKSRLLPRKKIAVSRNFVTPRSTELLLSGGGVKVVKVIDSPSPREFGAIIRVAFSSFSFFSTKEIFVHCENSFHS